MRTIATIRGNDEPDGRKIMIGVVSGRLTASNGDEVHPNARPYARGQAGLWQAVKDIDAMYGHGRWETLTWSNYADTIHESDKPGYVDEI